MYRKPELPNDVYIADNATIVGDAILEKDVSVWYNAVIRADNNKIIVREGSNIQDSCVLHTDEDDVLEVGRYVTVGHGAILHGCKIGDYSLIGMGAIILNGAVIGKNCIVGAGALVTSGTVVEDGMMILGSPAKPKRPLKEEELAALKEDYKHYIHLGREHFLDEPGVL